MNVREHIWNMGIVYSVAVPRPTRTRLETAVLHPLKPGEIHPPHIAFSCRQRPTISQMLQALPGKR
ncbi:uncharacterized protein METZ01_LOCUS278388, partial [marine metagenome]